MPITKLANLINPEVMGDMISAALPKAIKFTPFAKVDTTLEGTPGNEITVPAWGYIGDAETIAEGEAVTPAQMSTSSKKFSIAKAVKVVEITDESILSGYGDPVGQATAQIKMAIAAKVETDVITALQQATIALDKGTEKISYAGIVAGVDKFEEEEATEKYLFIHPNQVATLRLDTQFIDKTKYGNEVMMTGEIGMIAGCRVVVTKRTPEDGGSKYLNFIICVTKEPEDGTPVLPAVTIYLKRKVMVENDRDVLKATNVIVANEHYGAALTNESKVVKVTFLK